MSLGKKLIFSDDSAGREIPQQHLARLAQIDACDGDEAPPVWRPGQIVGARSRGVSCKRADDLAGR